MKKDTLLLTISLICLLALAPAFPVLAQDNGGSDDDVPELSLWRGGNLNVDFNLNLNLLGIGSGSAMMGGVMSGRVQNGAAALFTNPAALGTTNQRSFIFDGQFGYGTGITPSINNEIRSSINDEIATETENFLTDPDNFDLQPDAYTSFTNMNSLNAGVGSQMGSFALSWPVHERLVLAIGANQPVNMQFRLQSSGLSTKLAQEQGTDDVSVRFDVLMNISALIDVTFQMNTFSMGFGSQVYDGAFGSLSVGGAIQQYHLQNKRNFSTDLSGMVVVGNADERFFNNPNDPNLNFEAGESNSFFMQANGFFEDRQTGFSLSAVYQAPRIATFSVMYQQMPEFTLSDPNAFSRAFLPIFIVSDDILGGDIDVRLDTLRANKPNLTTERDISRLVNEAKFQLPSSLRFGLDLALGRHTVVLNYTSYLSNLEFEIGDSYYGKQATHGVGFGVNMVFSDKFRLRSIPALPIRLLYLDVDGLLMQAFRGFTNYSNPQYSFGVSAMLGDSIEGGSDGAIADVMGLPLPTGFSMGRRYDVFNGVTVGLNIFAAPDLFFRYSIGYTF